MPHFLDDRLTDGGKFVNHTHRPPFTSQEDSWFLLEADAIVRLEGLGKLKKIYLIGTRSRNFPAVLSLN
jgi:hypothetical protein